MTTPNPITATEIFIALVGASALIAVVSRRWTVLPYSVALVVLGLGVSALSLPVELTVEPEVVLVVLLPGLVFETAYRTDIRLLWHNAGAVAFLAVPGVLITAGVVALVLNAVSGVGLVLAFLVGAMLSATDPAAVIAVFSRVRAPERLITLIESEAIFNDGTGIVLFALALQAVAGPVEPMALVGELLRTIAISAVVGAAIGLLVSRGILWVEDHLVELMLSVAAAYGSYLLADRLGQSGLIATVVCGLVFGSYGRRLGMTVRGAEAMDTVWEFAAYLLTTFVFLLIGLAITVQQLSQALLPAIAVLAALLVSRAVIVYVMLGWGSRLAARFRLTSPMPWEWLHLTAWSGLRGAVSVALALSLPANLAHRQLLQEVVFACVLLTLILQGGSVQTLVQRLGLHIRPDPDEDPGGTSDAAAKA
jgi:CPA1 family monovalent cation:H+ antiporter